MIEHKWIDNNFRNIRRYIVGNLMNFPVKHKNNKSLLLLCVSRAYFFTYLSVLCSNLNFVIEVYICNMWIHCFPNFNIAYFLICQLLLLHLVSAIHRLNFKSVNIYFDSESTGFPSRDCFDSIENTREWKELEERRDRGKIIHRMEEILQSRGNSCTKDPPFSVVCSPCCTLLTKSRNASVAWTCLLNSLCLVVIARYDRGSRL